MAVNSVEKKAQQLNGYLRSHGKKQGKAWRVRIRALLAQTFEALNAKPLNGALCLELAGKIDREIAAVESGESIPEEEIVVCSQENLGKLENQTKTAPVSGWGQSEEAARIDLDNSAMKARIGQVDSDAAARIGLANSAAGEPRIESAQSLSEGSQKRIPEAVETHESDSGAGDTSPEKQETKNIEEVGLFDLIHVQIRCFFKLNACTRPPYIGKFVCYADKYGEVVQARVDRFIKVLSKNEDEYAAKLEVEVGYDEDLLPDMPERGLVLHPRKKKKS